MQSCFCFCFCLFRAAPMAYGSSQPRGGIGAAAASLHHSHSNAESLTHWARPGIKPESSRILVGIVTAEPQWDLQYRIFVGDDVEVIGKASPDVWVIPWAQPRDLVSGSLKRKDNTPKCGPIFHSTFFGQAAAKNKSYITRYLAGKCGVASWISCFSEVPWVYL